MPTKEDFRRAVLERRPELAGKLWLNRLIHSGMDYTVTVRGVMTYFWVGLDEPLDDALQGFFVHLDDALCP
jgi:hypothetical protein